jgi:hypothetical protein
LFQMVTMYIKLKSSVLFQARKTWCKKSTNVVQLPAVLQSQLSLITTLAVFSATLQVTWILFMIFQSLVMVWPLMARSIGPWETHGVLTGVKMASSECAEVLTTSQLSLIAHGQLQLIPGQNLKFTSLLMLKRTTLTMTRQCMTILKKFTKSNQQLLRHQNHRTVSWMKACTLVLVADFPMCLLVVRRRQLHVLGKYLLTKNCPWM